MSATTALLALAVLWAGVGLVLALVMGRRGHDPFPWWLLGTSAARSTGTPARAAAPGVPAGRNRFRKSPGHGIAVTCPPGGRS